MATLKGIETELLERAELFEVDQRALRPFMNKYDRETLITVCDGIDWGPVVQDWNDDTLLLVRGRGANIAFTVPIARAVKAAVDKEYAKRNKGMAPATNAMQEDGTQG